MVCRISTSHALLEILSFPGIESGSGFMEIRPKNCLVLAFRYLSGDETPNDVSSVLRFLADIGETIGFGNLAILRDRAAGLTEGYPGLFLTRETGCSSPRVPPQSR